MATPHRHRLSLQFTDRDAFGKFCVALAAENVSFSLGPFQTVAITETQLNQLPDQSRRLFEMAKTNGLVKVLPPTSSGKRYLPTTEEAKELFRKFAKSHSDARRS